MYEHYPSTKRTTTKQMSRDLISYDDVDSDPITDEQYRHNILYQYPHLDNNYALGELELLVDYLHTPLEFRIAFCQVTRSLPEYTQREIFNILLPDLIR